jgi:hypothetical protein
VSTTEGLPTPGTPVLGGGLDTQGVRQVPAAPVTNRKAEIAVMPHGYKSEVSSFVTIRPGQKIYFSFPLNHVGKTWHFEIPFRFALEKQGPYREPVSYLAFFWDDLPPTFRASSTEPSVQTASLPLSTLVHESGHVDPPKPQ